VGCQSSKETCSTSALWNLARLCRAMAAMGGWFDARQGDPTCGSATLALPVPAPTSATGVVVSCSRPAKARTSR